MQPIMRLVLFWLGSWLIAAPLTFGYDWEIDVCTGAIVLVCSVFCITGLPLGFIGAWLQAAPLLLGTPSPAAYLNDTLIGIVLIAVFILTQKRAKQSGFSPPGWSYNPSAFLQQIPIVIFGTIGWFLSRYLAAYQLGYIHTVWDPIFNQGTVRILTSSIAKAFPVSDAGLGALVYSFEVLLALAGGERRWYAMPWMVLLFGTLAVPASLVSTVLIILQPWVVGSWCFICLITALCTALTIPFAIDEVIASLQFLRTAKQPLWTAFWYGGGEIHTAPQPPPSARQGVSMPWHLALTALLGIALMLLPWWLGITSVLANSDHTAGALVLVTVIVSLAEIARSARYCNALLGLWVIGFSSFSIPHIAIGAALVALSFKSSTSK